MSGEQDTQKAEGGLLVLWCVAMLAVTLYGRDFVHCGVKSLWDWLMGWPKVALLLPDIFILLGICAVPLLVIYYSFTGHLERFKDGLIYSAAVFDIICS